MSKLENDLVRYLKNFITEERKKLFEEKIKARTRYITVVLENIFQSRNISASIRSSDCFGIQDIHVIENDNFFEDDSEVSMGGSKWIDIKHYNKKSNNTIDAINQLKKKGYKIIATSPHETDISLYDLNVNNKMAIIFGSEVNGCSHKALELADYKMKIPMYGFTESFNISVSVALCLQHLCYKIRNSKLNWKLNNQEKNEVMLKWLRKTIKASADIEKQFLEGNNIFS
ncbi:RNA methyltransferase [Flavobacteriales bacterium]|nr:RNA methyltransferase [Flavobacteriales bacterium]